MFLLFLKDFVLSFIFKFLKIFFCRRSVELCDDQSELTM